MNLACLAACLDVELRRVVIADAVAHPSLPVVGVSAG
jgi:hypothetical protein